MSSCDLLQITVPDARLQGTVKLLFAEGKFNGCNPNNEPVEFRDLASTSGFSIPQEPEMEPRYKYVCGKKEVVDIVVKENGLMISAILHDLTPENIKHLMRGKDLATQSQPALVAQPVDDLDFSEKNSTNDKIYRITDSSTGAKTPVLNVTSCIISNNGVPLIDGTDYVFSRAFGGIRFLKVQDSLLSVEVEASATNVTPYELGAEQPVQGWLKVLYYPTVDTIGEQCEPEVMLDQVGFIKFEDALEISEDSTSEPTLNFAVSGNVKVTDMRNLELV